MFSKFYVSKNKHNQENFKKIRFQTRDFHDLSAVIKQNSNTESRLQLITCCEVKLSCVAKFQCKRLIEHICSRFVAKNSFFLQHSTSMTKKMKD